VLTVLKSAQMKFDGAIWKTALYRNHAHAAITTGKLM